jgi:hypothetical protein
MPSVRAWILIGVTLRATLLALAFPVELQSDEAQYAFLGLSWERFGFLSDSQRFLWPPAYPYLHKLAFGAFQGDGVLAVRALQVLCSAGTGWAIATITRLLVSDRAAPWATAAWALHLPLAAYCFLGWPESLFITLLFSGLALMLQAERSSDDLKLITSGLLIGVAALFKELGLIIAIALAIRLALRQLKGSYGGLRSPALVFTVAAILPLMPWALRNAQRYDSLILSGSTLGENAYHGLNAKDVNFDALPVLRASGLDPRPDLGGPEWLRGEEDRAWARPGGATLSARQASKLSAGIHWATDDPIEFVTTRPAKFAHTFAPLSFPVRHLALGRIQGALGQGALGRSFLLIATLQSVLVLLFGIYAIARHAPRSSLYWVVTLTLCAQPLLVGMSRLRVPLLPLLFISLAAWHIERKPTRSFALGAIAITGLLSLWAMDSRAIAWLFQYTWGSLA